MKNILCDERGDADTIFEIIVIVVFLVIAYLLLRFMVSTPTQSLIIGIVIFIIYRVVSKTKEITQWIQPYIQCIEGYKLSFQVLLKLLAVSPIFNRYNNQYNQIKMLDEELLDSRTKITDISASIDNHENGILRVKAYNKREELSPASKIEVNKLTEIIANEIQARNKLEEKCSNIQISIEDKRETLVELIERARFTILGESDDTVIIEEEERKARKVEISKLIEETKELIDSNKKKIDEGYIIAALIDISTEINKIFEDYKSHKLSDKHTLEKIKELNTYVKKIVRPPKTYYDILEVDKNAGVEEIKKAYKKKIRDYHPDTISPESKPWIREYAEEMTKKINEAMDILGDPEKRRKYDIEIGIVDET